MNDLTILLTLKGRKSFTKRWLDWMALEGCPFKIILADGDADKKFTEDLIKSTNYKNLDIRHIKFPEDKDHQTFIKKFNKAVSLIKTEYTIFADNDDFIFIDNLKKGLQHLNNNSEFQTLALPHYRFSIKNHDYNAESKLYSYGGDITFETLKPIENGLFDSPRPLKRLANCIKYFPSDYFYYAIHRTRNIKKIMQITLDYPIDYIFFWERHITYSVGVIGDICSGMTLEPFVVRQEETSMHAASLVNKEKLINIRYSDSWKRQYSGFVKGIYKLIKEHDKISKSKFNLFFRIYFGLNIKIRILQGLIGSIFRSLPSIFTLLNMDLLRRLGKSRIAINQSSTSGNTNLQNLSNFLDKKYSHVIADNHYGRI